MQKTLKRLLGVGMIALIGTLAVVVVMNLFRLIPGNNPSADVTDTTTAPVTETTVLPTIEPTEEIVPGMTMEPLIDAYKVIIRDKVVGFIEDPDSIEEIRQSFQLEYEITENVKNTVCVTLTSVTTEPTKTYRNNLTDLSTIKNAMNGCYTFKINAYEFFAEGFSLGYFQTQSECNKLLEEARKKFLEMNFANKSILSSKYDTEFETVPVVIFKSQISEDSYSAAVDMILSGAVVTKKLNVTAMVQLNEIINGNGVTLVSDYDSIVTELNSNGSAEVTFNERISNFNIVTASEEESPIAFTTEYKANTSQWYTYSKVTRKGVTGTMTASYSNTYLNADFISSALITEKITTKPVGQIIEYGTRISTWTTVKALTGKGMFVWPIGGFITQHWSKGGHTGIDIAAVQGTAVYAAMSGTIKYTEVAQGRVGLGTHVVITHENGYETYYGHMKSFIVSKGQYVVQGQLIGYSGNTGNSTGPHLHFGVAKDGTYYNPTDWLYGYAA